MKRRPSRIEKYDNLFCGRGCKDAHHSEKSLQRDSHQCQECGDSDELHVHHIEPVSKGGAKFETENLITPCPKHHRERH